MTETTAPPDLVLTDLVDQLRTELPAELDRAWRIHKPVAHQAVLEEVAAALSERFALIGGTAEHDPTDLGRWIIFEWLEEAKEFLILLRNILFEEQRAQLMVYEEKLTEEDFGRLKTVAAERSGEAADALLTSLTGFEGKPIQLGQKRKQWNVQRSPWPVYQLQLTEYRDQLRDLRTQHADLLLTAEVYHRLQTLFRNTFANFLKYLERLSEKLDAALQPDAAGEASTSAAALLRLIAGHSGEAPEPDTAAEFIERLETLTQGLPTTRNLVAGTSGGLLLRRDLNVQRATTNWVESELMNELQDFYLRRGQIESRLQIAIQTGENRLELSDEAAKSVASQDIPQTMAQLAKHLHKSVDDIREIETEVLRHLDYELYAYRVQQPDFLHLDMQQTLSQYRRYQESGWQQLQQWGKRQWRTLRNLNRENRREEQLSFSERTVRLIRSRSVAPDTAHYSSMFLTKGYTGESFRVGREVELERVAQIVANWREGYRGALLITGRRMSGKTFFGELVAHRHFSNNFITLTPGVRIDLGGRLLEPTRNLKVAVEFVVRNAARQPLMLWIDDLSNWRGEETPLVSDVLVFLNTIDYNAGKFFFVVSAGSEFHGQLQQYTDIDRHFQAILPMERMSLEDIQRAIWIRHGATQLHFVDDNGEDLDADHLNRLIGSVYRSSRGHIGNALRLWAYAIEKHGEDEVCFAGVPPYAFPEEISQDTGLLLRTVLVDRITNEYHLRKQFGPVFRERFQPLVQRLLNLGILLRKPSGALEINPCIATEIELLLERKGFVLSDLHAENPTV